MAEQDTMRLLQYMNQRHAALSALIADGGKHRLQQQLGQIAQPTSRRSTGESPPRRASAYPQARRESVGSLQQAMAESPPVTQLVAHRPNGTEHPEDLHGASRHHVLAQALGNAANERTNDAAATDEAMTQDVVDRSVQAMWQARMAAARRPVTTDQGRHRFKRLMHVTHIEALARMAISRPHNQHTCDRQEPTLSTQLEPTTMLTTTTADDSEPLDQNPPQDMSSTLTRRYSLVDDRGRPPTSELVNDNTYFPSRRHTTGVMLPRVFKQTSQVARDMQDCYLAALPPAKRDHLDNPTGHEILSPDEFGHMLQHVLGFQDPAWAAKCYVACVRESTRVTLLAFADVVNLLKCGTDHDKMQFVFSIYDTDANGTIEVDEVFQTLHSDNDDMWDQVMFSQLLLGLVTPLHVGKMGFQEFASACQNIPMFFICFAGPLPLRLSNQPDTVKCRLRLEVLRTMWSFGVKKSAMETAHAISADAFKTIISYFFRFSKASTIDQALATRIFQTFAPTNATSIDFDEFIRGLFTLLDGAVEPRGRMLHSILDLDRGGTVTKSEIDQILQARARTVQRHQIKDLHLDRNAAAIMEVLDANGDGAISVDGMLSENNIEKTQTELTMTNGGVEFIAAVHKSPHVLTDLLDILCSGCHFDTTFSTDKCMLLDERDPHMVPPHPRQLMRDFKKVFEIAVKKMSAVAEWRRTASMPPQIPKVTSMQPH
ncbi:Aste57867_1179 [Aphanomyces stellatus]|uniref:Aste57867_1179 protein n=1 Tax=Aphanomyces stellatus TaxID=120398 RepID=A0A485K5T5_9STRA|nr:hypothetical protein As57867_001178 [Aphanomyces stellatus]VFT78399.1 Aste57867_1179 [Aphanomyces stellatus]